MAVRLTAIVCILILLSGCAASNDSLDRAMALRNRVATGDGCSFQTTVTADYGEHIYVFSMDCKTDKDGNLAFRVTAPETIAGITGNITASGGNITFDDQVLAFQLMADGQVTPVSAPWLLIKTLRGGYLKACATTDDGLEISIDDSYEEDALHLRICTAGDVPATGEIFWQGRRVLTLTVENFTYL